MNFPSSCQVNPFSRAVGTVRLPGSKSISNRALLLAALASGTTRLEGVLQADDTDRMIDSLMRLGLTIRRNGQTVEIEGCAGQFAVKKADLFIGNSGTTARMLTAALAFAGGNYRLDGIERMRERPIGDLLEALRSLGASIRCELREGFPPLHFSPAQASGSQVSVRGNVSSQFLTALLLVAPLIAPAQGLTVHIEGELISRPYIALTIAMMHSFGVEVVERDGAFHIPAGRYVAPGTYQVEGDASAASYFFALGAISGGPVRIEGLLRPSLQGDAAFSSIMEQMGATVKWDKTAAVVSREASSVLRGIELDCTAIPDAAMTLVPMALFCQGPVLLRGIGSWRVKETDRLSAMATEARKFGLAVEEGADWIRVERVSETVPKEICIQTYNDHRIAMSFALGAAAGHAVQIEDPKCTAKTYPGYFADLGRLIEQTIF